MPCPRESDFAADSGRTSLSQHGHEPAISSAPGGENPHPRVLLGPARRSAAARGVTILTRARTITTGVREPERAPEPEFVPASDQMQPPPAVVSEPVPQRGGFAQWSTGISFVLLALCWGSSFLWIKLGLTGFTAIQLVTLQNMLSAGVLWLIVRGVERREGRFDERARTAPTRRDIWLVAVLSVLPYILLVFGEESVDSGIAALVIATEPLWTIVMLRFIQGGAQVTVRQWVGVCLGLLGVALLHGSTFLHAGTRAETSLVGMVALLFSAIIFAVLGLHVARRFHSVSAVRVAAWSASGSFLLISPLGLWSLLHDGFMLTPKSVTGLLALALFDSSLGWFLYYRLVRQIGPARATQVNYALPVVALFWGILLLGERLTLASAIGSIAIMCGITLGSATFIRAAHRRRRDARRDVAREAESVRKIPPIADVPDRGAA